MGRNDVGKQPSTALGVTGPWRAVAEVGITWNLVALSSPGACYGGWRLLVPMFLTPPGPKSWHGLLITLPLGS